MVFSSHIFLYYFLPAALLLYYGSLLVSKRLWGGTTACVLTLLSYVFYGWNRPDYCLLMLGSSLLDYWCGIGMVRDQARERRGTRFLWVSMIGNLGLLAYFKYSNLGVSTWNDAVAALGRGDLAFKNWQAIALPVGISFYTFQTMSYTIDLWRKSISPARSFFDFMAYVSMFPQLVAGPIVRYSDVQAELIKREHTLDKFYAGVLFLQFGIVKKVLIADNLAALADQAFGTGRFAPAGSGLGLVPAGIGVFDAWVGALAYTFQIYFDFSGYSDMAIGLGLMIGFTFPVNFDRPYRSVSITDFWRRWHISLSTWLRDYLYIALGGNRKGSFRTYVNLSLTMLLGGLWHGAQWTFVAWGAFQGLWLVIERALGKRSLYGPAPTAVRIGLTFVVVVVGWVFFKSPNLAGAGHYLAAMCGANGVGAPLLEIKPLFHGLIFAAAAVVTWCFPTTQSIVARNPVGYVLVVQPLFLLALTHLHWEENVPFLYFQF